MKNRQKTNKDGKYKYQYAVKFICTSNVPGTSQTTDALLPGAYKTAVNIHNPFEKTVYFRVKLASSIEISKYFEESLKPDGVMRKSCGQISDFGIRPIHGYEGFMVIESQVPLDVTAVYTAGENAGEVKSIDVEQIRRRKLK